MQAKFIFLSILLIVAVLLTACSGNIQFGQAQPRTINVTGTAQVILAPDIAYVSIGVHSEAQTAKEAVAANNEASQTVIDAIKAQGVDPKDIQTTNFSVYQNQKYSPTGENQGTFFMADNTVYVTMRDLPKIGAILDAAIGAGANNIYGITFDVQDKDKALASGRDKAIADAKAQADQLAAATGATLGPVQNINYYNNPPTPYYYDTNSAGGMGAAPAATVPVTPGQLTMTVSVNVTYGLK